MQLLAGRWSLDGTTNYPDSALLNAENIGVNWRIDAFGVQRIEVLVKTRNKYDRFNRYKNHLGQRLALYSGWSYRPISGFVTSVEPAGANRILYTAKGPGACRMEDELDTTIYATSDTLDAVIKAMLTAHVSVSSATQDNIDANATTIGGWQPRHPQGSYPHQVIKDLLKKSDSSGNIWDFWFKDEPFSGVALSDYLPYYKARSTSAAADWIVHSRDMTRETISRDINNIADDVTVYYGTITGTHDGGNNITDRLIDSSENFRTDGVKPGDKITNLTDGSRATVTRVDSTVTTVYHDGLSGGTDNDFDNSDTFAIELQEPKSSQTDTATSDYWSRAVATFEKEMTLTQANQYAEILADVTPRQVQSFTVGAPFIRKALGGKFPLWEVIAQGGGYIRWADMYPAAAQFSTSLNDETTFIITGLDYDYARNQLSVTLDNPSTRLDARLRREGILGSELIQRGQ